MNLGIDKFGKKKHTFNIYRRETTAQASQAMVGATFGRGGEGMRGHAIAHHITTTKFYYNNYTMHVYLFANFYYSLRCCTVYINI